jgi:hypothetical protein
MAVSDGLMDGAKSTYSFRLLPAALIPAARCFKMAKASCRDCSSMGRSSGASSVDVGVLSFFAFTNLLEGSLDVSSANFPDSILRFVLGNFDEGIFFLAVDRLSDGDFAMSAAFLIDED